MKISTEKKGETRTARHLVSCCEHDGRPDGHHMHERAEECRGGLQLLVATWGRFNDCGEQKNEVQKNKRRRLEKFDNNGRLTPRPPVVK